MLKWGGVGVGYWHITGLHGHELLMRLKVVIFGEHPSSNKLFLENGHKIKEVFGGVVADVIHFIRRNGQAVVAVALFGSVLHHTHHAFHNIVNVSEIALAVTVVENLDGFAFHQFVGEAEVCHIGATSRTINGEETEAC